jgi:Protein of unknown function (DUF3105)
MDSSSQTKRERRLAARSERQRLAQEGRRKARQRRRLIVAALVILGVGLLAAAVLFMGQAISKPAPGRTVPDEGRNHVAQGEPIEFRNNPPASGNHYPTWARSGVYAEPQHPGNWVHNLEHGYIVILYNCPGDCPDLTQQLRQFYDSAPRSQKYGYQKLVITPYADMDHRIAAVAWNRVDEMDELDLERLSSFYRTYLEKGPEDAP